MASALTLREPQGDILFFYQVVSIKYQDFFGLVVHWFISSLGDGGDAEFAVASYLAMTIGVGVDSYWYGGRADFAVASYLAMIMKICSLGWLVILLRCHWSLFEH